MTDKQPVGKKSEGPFTLLENSSLRSRPHKVICYKSGCEIPLEEVCDILNAKHIVGPYSLINGTLIDGDGKLVPPRVLPVLLNAKPEPVEGLQELKKLCKAAGDAYPIFGELTGGFVSQEQKVDALNNLIDCTNDAEQKLTALGVELD